MAEGSEISRWRRSRLLAIAVVAIGVVASSLSILFARTLNTDDVAGIPSGLIAATVAVPMFILLLIFWSAERQRRLDGAHGHFED